MLENKILEVCVIGYWLQKKGQIFICRLDKKNKKIRSTKIWQFEETAASHMQFLKYILFKKNALSYKNI